MSEITYDDVERITGELFDRVESGETLASDRRLALWLLADPELDFYRGETLAIGVLIAVADGELAEARQYLTALTDDSEDIGWRHGMYAAAESRIFGYLDGLRKC